MNVLHQELLKSGLSLGVSVTTVALGWFVGQRLTVRYNLRQKQREYDLATAQEFHRLYGEFFKIWKLWNYSLKDASLTLTRSDLLARACAAEGAMESIFVRLAATRDLKPQDRASLGRFRQAFQSIREAIRDNEGIQWSYASHPKYLAFKRLATEVALLIVSENSPDPQTAKTRAEALVSVTSNAWEENWYQDGATEGRCDKAR
jgi:hypothetical protein